MTFRTHNDLYVDINNTSLRGYIHATYAELVETFGAPTTGDDDKTDVEWHLRFHDGTVATIYNWKNGPAYGGPPVQELTDWNIGGHTGKALDYIQLLLEAN
jgi:hypothetical protein